MTGPPRGGRRLASARSGWSRRGFSRSRPGLPVLFGRWRGKGPASQPQLAAQMVKELAEAFPGRLVHGTGDAAFHGESLVIASETWTTRLPANAGLHAHT